MLTGASPWRFLHRRPQLPLGFALSSTLRLVWRIDTLVQDDTVWLSKEQIAKLFGRDRTVISKHISNIYKEHEVTKEATCANFAQVQTEGEREVVR